MIAKLCGVCGADLSNRKRSDHRYCGVRCRVRAHRIRAAVGLRALRSQRRADRQTRAHAARMQEAAKTIEELRAQLHEEHEQRQKMESRIEKLRALLASAREDHERAAEDYERTIAKLKRQQSELPSEDEVDLLRHQLRVARQRNAELEREQRGAIAAESKAEKLRRQNPHPRINEKPQARDEALAQEVQTLKQALSEATGKLAKLAAVSQRAAELEATVTQLSESLHNAHSREASLQTVNTALRQRVDAALDRAAHEKDLRVSQGGWIRAAQFIGLGLLGRAANQKAEAPSTEPVPPPADAVPVVPAESTRAATESPPATEPPPKPSVSPNLEWERRIAFAKRQGWQPRADRLVSLIRKELEQQSKLAEWQRLKGLPVTGQALPPDADVLSLASLAALQARWNYHEHPPSEIKHRVLWISKPYKLDSRSEEALEAVVSSRIDKLKAAMREQT